jgi:hypothetical protein
MTGMRPPHKLDQTPDAAFRSAQDTAGSNSPRHRLHRSRWPIASLLVLLVASGAVYVVLRARSASRAPTVEEDACASMAQEERTRASFPTRPARRRVPSPPGS